MESPKSPRRSRWPRVVALGRVVDACAVSDPARVFSDARSRFFVVSRQQIPPYKSCAGDFCALSEIEWELRRRRTLMWR